MSCRRHDPLPGDDDSPTPLHREMPHEGDDPLDDIRPPSKPVVGRDVFVGIGAGCLIVAAFGATVWVLRHTLFA